MLVVAATSFSALEAVPTAAVVAPVVDADDEEAEQDAEEVAEFSPTTFWLDSPSSAASGVPSAPAPSAGPPSAVVLDEEELSCSLNFSAASFFNFSAVSSMNFSAISAVIPLLFSLTTKK